MLCVGAVCVVKKEREQKIHEISKKVFTYWVERESGMTVIPYYYGAKY